MIDFLLRLFSIKYAALAFLVLQNTFLVVYMHYSRISDGPMYASSTAVVSMEVLKFVSCLTVVAYQRGSLSGLYRTIRDELLSQPLEILRLSVPSLLYTIQNNLLYYALSHLDAATFQVGYQVKILTTAVFSVFILGTRLSFMQWISLVILTIGVSMAQLSANKVDGTNAHSNTTAGFIAVLLAACTSGFSGVYFESIIKNSGASLWVRNMQMGLSSIVLGMLGIYFSGEWELVSTNGFFYGYNNVVIAVILLQAIGGLIVAVVVKYADNILKGFAASFSIVTSCILSYLVFDFHPNGLFLIGAVLVNISMYMYSTYAEVTKNGRTSGEEHQPLIESRVVSGASNLTTVDIYDSNNDNLHTECSSPTGSSSVAAALERGQAPHSVIISNSSSSNSGISSSRSFHINR